MILLKIDRNRSTPIFRQIIQQVIELIERDILEEGTALPSSRELAGKLGVDRTTVYRAYQELMALGYLVSRPGSYTTVRKRPKVITKISPPEKGLINWSKISSESSRYLYNVYRNFSPEKAPDAPPDLINLSTLNPDSRIFPVNDFRRCMNQVLVNEGPKILSYGEYAGYRPLREDIAQRLQIHGIAASPDDVLITNGAQQALELILKLLAGKGRKVAIESPTYANMIPLLRHHNISILEIPMDNKGMDLGVLKSRLEKDRPAFVYTIPNFHNPTGITTSQSHREALLRLCEEYAVPLVEDGFEEEMKYFGKVVLPIKSMDRNQVVIYLGTFSKVLFPGVRIGWIAAERECIKRLTAIKRFVDLSGSTVVQAAMSAFLRQGYYDLHLKRMHRIFRKRMQVALNSLKESLPRHINWTKPDGGYTIWVDLKQSYEDEPSLKEFLLKYRVMASPGDYYFHSSQPRRYLRISIASLNEHEIREGIARLGRALDEFKGGKE